MINLKSLRKDGDECFCEFVTHLLVPSSNLEQIESSYWMHSAANLKLFSDVLELIIFIVLFKKRFMCSGCRSIDAILLVLTQ